MAVNYLQKLPRELRDQIHREIFESPDGTMVVYQRQGEERYTISNKAANMGEWNVKLSMLRTCKLFNDECKNMIWEYNNFDLDESWELMIDTENQSKIWSRVQRVQLRSNFSGFSIPASIDYFGINLGEEGKLNRIRLLLRYRLNHRDLLEYRDLEKIIEMSIRQKESQFLEGYDRYGEHLMSLREARDSYFNNCQRELVIQMGQPVSALKFDPSETLEEIREAFGATLKGSWKLPSPVLDSRAGP